MSALFGNTLESFQPSPMVTIAPIENILAPKPVEMPKTYQVGFLEADKMSYHDYKRKKFTGTIWAIVLVFVVTVFLIVFCIWITRLPGPSGPLPAPVPNYQPLPTTSSSRNLEIDILLGIVDPVASFSTSDVDHHFGYLLDENKKYLTSPILPNIIYFSDGEYSGRKVFIPNLEQLSLKDVALVVEDSLERALRSMISRIPPNQPRIVKAGETVYFKGKLQVGSEIYTSSPIKFNRIVTVKYFID